MLREYVISEAMAALGIPTTRSLAVVTTGEPVYRETPLPGAVLTRVAASHIRVGTFQYFAARGDVEARAAAGRLRDRPPLPGLAARAEHPYRALLGAVIDAPGARSIARWMLVGFIHGVMNTDNMAISGETIDYGPCAFMDAYDPATVFSSIDHGGRYAYGNQPRHRAVEPGPARRDAAAAAGRGRDRAGDRARQGTLARLRPAPSRRPSWRPAPQARPAHETREGDLALAEDLLARMAGERRRLHPDLPPPVRRGGGAEGDAAARALFADPARL